MLELVSSKEFMGWKKRFFDEFLAGVVLIIGMRFGLGGFPPSPIVLPRF